MLPPDDPEPAPDPSAAPEEAPVPPDADTPDALDAPTAVAEDDPMLPLPGDSWPELPGGDEELAEPPPELAPEPAPHRSNRWAAATRGATTPSPVDPAPVPDAVAVGSDSGVLMKSLPVVRSAERVPPAAEVALPVAARGLADPGPAPFDRRGPVAVSVVLICAALGAHALAAWRRRPSRYWPA